ncbi:hypothetical protein SAMN04488009_1520 [Maribacter sedimenticola]|uniref:PH domain-containing protein n=1 Tax=Maribacter sedimenticola TaxID=228956 RepID=A0ABY1SFE5_9FLAO|nr:hypothetical protein [Maribacter sedimenticola]SNR41608.1 hypothetical protein SAMN04488009_1520 [Maribacter sedimenticola]
MAKKIYFKETQKFTQGWLWILLITPLALLVYQVLAPIFQTVPNTSGNLSFSITAPKSFWISFLVLLLVILLIAFSKLKTIITEDTIQIRHLLFVKKIINTKDIEKAEMITYGFVGYGIRLSLKHGTVYNVKGNTGLAIILKNGSKYLIGTQKKKELSGVIKKILPDM